MGSGLRYGGPKSRQAPWVNLDGLGLDLLGGHGGRDRKSQSKRGDEPMALGKADSFAAIIEVLGI